MSHDVIRTAVNRHSCCIGSTRYAFRLKWVAVQQSPESPHARLLLRVDAVPTLGPSKRRVLLHVLTQPGPGEDLCRMLDDALRQHFVEQREASNATGEADSLTPTDVAR